MGAANGRGRGALAHLLLMVCLKLFAQVLPMHTGLAPGRHTISCEIDQRTNDPQGGHMFLIIALMFVRSRPLSLRLEYSMTRRKGLNRPSLCPSFVSHCIASTHRALSPLFASSRFSPEPIERLRVAPATRPCTSNVALLALPGACLSVQSVC